MKQELYFYDIYPKVVPSQRETAITIKPLSPHKAFLEENYIVKVIPMTYEHYAANRHEPVTYEICPKQGVITFSHAFLGEQQHSIRLYPSSNPNNCEAALSVYSLYEDLMKLRPYLGDFHVHSCRSDGKEAPAFVAAMYRQEGFDFAALTDHGMYYPSLEAIEAYQDLGLEFKLYPGEEVHTPGNHIHIINFGGSFSVNELAKFNTNILWSSDPRPEWLEEVKAIEQTLPPLPDGVDSFVHASCLLIFKKIREAGGLGIFCHPHWIADVYHVADAFTKFYLENNFADAFELIGGQSCLENGMQLAFYHDIQANGNSVPIVGSSDSHGTLNGKLFKEMKTIVFAKDNSLPSIIDSVKQGYSVAVNDCGENNVQMYSTCQGTSYYRLVSYAFFLYYYYFPLHHELCFEEGRLMRRFLGGDEKAKERILSIKGQTLDLMNKLFVSE